MGKLIFILFLLTSIVFGFQNCGSDGGGASSPSNTASSVQNIWVYEQGKVLLSEHNDFSKLFYLNITVEPNSPARTGDYYKGFFNADGTIDRLMECEGAISIVGETSSGSVQIANNRCYSTTSGRWVEEAEVQVYTYEIEGNRLELCHEGECAQYLLGEAL